MSKKELEELSKSELVELVEIYAKNHLAIDGFWFQSVERKSGMDEAMYYDSEAWRGYTVSEARRIKAFLGLSERPGLEGLQRALEYRFSAVLNEHESILEEGRLIYRIKECRVQTARSRKGMPLHPCKSVGIIEYSGFAETIDDRIKCRCISCYPDCTESPEGCAWEFVMSDHQSAET